MSPWTTEHSRAWTSLSVFSTAAETQPLIWQHDLKVPTAIIWWNKQSIWILGRVSCVSVCVYMRNEEHMSHSRVICSQANGAGELFQAPGFYFGGRLCYCFPLFSLLLYLDVAVVLGLLLGVHWMIHWKQWRVDQAASVWVIRLYQSASHSGYL